MGIALFVIALVSNIFIILIMRYGFTGNYEYKQGMLLGVHIPQENIGDEEVVSLMEKANRAEIPGLYDRIFGLFTTGAIRKGRGCGDLLGEIPGAEADIRTRCVDLKVTFKSSKNGTQNIFERREFEADGLSR